MKEILFPKTIDNTYKGHKITKWLLYLYVFRQIGAAFTHMFTADGGAQSIASITLDAFSTEAAGSVISMFGYWGLEQLVIGLIIIAILARYKSLIPAAWLIYSIEFSGRFLLKFIMPGVPTTHTPPGVFLDYFFVPLAIIMLIVSVTSTKKNKELLNE